MSRCRDAAGWRKWAEGAQGAQAHEPLGIEQQIPQHGRGARVREKYDTSAARARISALMSTRSSVSSNSTIVRSQQFRVRVKCGWRPASAADHGSQDLRGVQTDLAIRMAQR